MPGLTPLTETSAEKPAANRTERARMKTRNKLIAAAVVVMGRDGVDGATIAAIAEEADVGFGSFYNHFKTKEEIARAVFDLRSEDLQNNLAAIKAVVTDPALQVSLISRLVIFQTVQDPVWGWFLIRAGETVEEYRRVMFERSISTFIQGREQGRFSFPSPETAAIMVNAIVFGVIRAILNGDLSHNASFFAVEHILRALGITEKDARSLATSLVPPELDRPVFLEMAAQEARLG